MSPARASSCVRALENKAAEAMTFKPGQSGNPGGRPKELKQAQELARVHSRRSRFCCRSRPRAIGGGSRPGGDCAARSRLRQAGPSGATSGPSPCFPSRPGKCSVFFFDGNEQSHASARQLRGWKLMDTGSPGDLSSGRPTYERMEPSCKKLRPYPPVQLHGQASAAHVVEDRAIARSSRARTCCRAPPVTGHSPAAAARASHAGRYWADARRNRIRRTSRTSRCREQACSPGNSARAGGRACYAAHLSAIAFI
jgi:hypothetical protein